MDNQQIQQRLIDSGRILEANGLADMTQGHVSVRMPSDVNKFYMKPHSWGFSEITLENMVICDLEGEKIGGGGRRHSEVYIHSEIYKVRPDVQSVIHCHPVHAVAFSSTGKKLLPISQPSCKFYGDHLPVYTDTIELIRNQEKGAGVAKVLGQNKAALMRNHGVVVVGGSVEESTMLALALEEACRIQLLAEAGGGVGELFDNATIERLYKTLQPTEMYAINFDYLLRKLAKGQ